ncbi:MAG: hypothetical protein ABH845_02315, partial [Candidatus Omnitrophota bacterium]
MVETFLWSTLSFDLALACGPAEKYALIPTAHLRPRSIADGGIRQLVFDLTGKSDVTSAQSGPTVTAQLAAPVMPMPAGTVGTLPFAQDGAGKPFRGEFPTASYLNQNLSVPELTVFQMAVSPLRAPTESTPLTQDEIQNFFRYTQAVGLDDLMLIQNVSGRISRSPNLGAQKGSLIGSIATLKRKVAPLLEHINPLPAATLGEVLSSGTENVDPSLQMAFQSAFETASTMRGTVEQKLHLIEGFLGTSSSSQPTAERILRVLSLMGTLQSPEAIRDAIGSFVGRYGFSKSATHLAKIFDATGEDTVKTARDGAGKDLPAGSRDLVRQIIWSVLGVEAPHATIDYLVQALEDGKISFTSVAFEIGNWARTVSAGRRGTQATKEELTRLFSDHPELFQQLAVE